VATMFKQETLLTKRIPGLETLPVEKWQQYYGYF